MIERKMTHALMHHVWNLTCNIRVLDFFPPSRIFYQLNCIRIEFDM